MWRESYLGTRCDLCGDDTAAFKGTAEMICVDGSGVPLFIGHVTPWGRTNWCPPHKRAPCFVPGAHKDIGLRLAWRMEGWGGGKGEARSRFPIEYLAGMNWRGPSPLGCSGT